MLRISKTCGITERSVVCGPVCGRPRGPRLIRNYDPRSRIVPPRHTRAPRYGFDCNKAVCHILQATGVGRKGPWVVVLKR
eukprot:3913703-Prymnesium_polylepis.1